MKKEIDIIDDVRASKAEKKVAYDSLRHKRLNPLPEKDFDPKTFDPMGDIEDADLRCRKRKVPQRRLPSMGMYPKEILEGQMVGMYESPQDLYLLIAWLSERVSDLEDALERANIVKINDKINT